MGDHPPGSSSGNGRWGNFQPRSHRHFMQGMKKAKSVENLAGPLGPSGCEGYDGTIATSVSARLRTGRWTRS